MVGDRAGAQGGGGGGGGGPSLPFRIRQGPTRSEPLEAASGP